MAFFYRLLFYISGMLFISLGVSLTIKADIGVGAWDALNVGLAETGGLTIGSWLIIVGFFLIILNGILYKEKPNFLGVIPIVVIGPLIDLWLLVILKNFNVDVLWLRVVVLTTGILLIGLGVAMYLQPKFPVNPIDNLMLAIQHRFKINLMVAKTMGEVVALLLALLVKGPIGIGTVFMTILIGPSIQFFFPYCERLLANLVSKRTIPH